MSTQAIRGLMDRGLVLLPVMPKGVEHSRRWRRCYGRRIVLLPVMPKGVEHLTDADIAAMIAAVLLPVMPKGVEHIAQLAQLDVKGGTCAPPGAAERR